jgi:hypothetical protein
MNHRFEAVDTHVSRRTRREPQCRVNPIVAIWALGVHVIGPAPTAGQDDIHQIAGVVSSSPNDAA